MLILGFERNESCLPIILRNYQFTYAARDLLKALINGLGGWLSGEGRHFRRSLLSGS